MDRYRPRYHFTPPRNWMNDPNGPFQRQGEYHLFYQHNPSGTEWGNIHWGHAKSADLVHWQWLPVALAPSHQLGELHCYSGCSVVDGDEVKLFYTSIGEGTRNATDGAQQWVAWSDDLISWSKSESNPILTDDLHGEYRVTEWRDPFVWKERDNWNMLLGGIHEDKGCGLIYRSSDLKNWRFEGVFHRGEEPIWECPHLFRFGDKVVLCYSPCGPVQYVSGTASESGFSEILYQGTVDYGGWEGFYASTGFDDEEGRRILLGWMPESRGESFPIPLDWTGALALPRQVRLNDNGALSIAPIPELETLRGERQRLADFGVGQTPLETGVRSSSFEIEVEFARLSELEGELTVSVLASPCGRERTDVRLDFITGTIEIDRSLSSLFPGVHKSSVIGKWNRNDRDESLKLRIFVDRSSIETFVGDETCLTARVYPSLEESEGILFRANREIRIDEMNIWEMRAANIG